MESGHAELNQTKCNDQQPGSDVQPGTQTRRQLRGAAECPERCVQNGVRNSFPAKIRLPVPGVTQPTAPGPGMTGHSPG